MHHISVILLLLERMPKTERCEEFTIQPFTESLQVQPMHHHNFGGSIYKAVQLRKPILKKLLTYSTDEASQPEEDPDPYD